MNRISALLDSLNTSEQWIFRLAATAVVIGCVGIGAIALSYVTHTIADYGGTYTEGMVGYPTAPNPILATTSTDQSLARLVYSGILRKASWNKYISDLGSCKSDHNPSNITCILSPKAVFHDGTPVTSADVLFTIETIQKIGERSPWYPSLVGVTVTKADERTVTFHLPKPFSGFDETLTLGIIPEHIWRDIPVSDIESQSTLESMMIGSGPYTVDKHTSSGDHISSTLLSSNKKYTSGAPFISNIKLHYYTATDELIRAFNKNNIDGFVLESESVHMLSDVKNTYKRMPIIHPDIYGVFTKASLAEEKKHLALLEPRMRSIDIANHGFPWNKPLPPWNAEELLDISQKNDIMSAIGPTESTNTSTLPQTSRILVTVDQETLVDLTTEIARALNAIGLPAEMRVFDFSGFKNSVVPKRSFNFLVFGQRYRHISDAYAYWNSEERTDPGLNVTETIDANIDTYTNSLTRHGKSNTDYRDLYDKLNQRIETDQVFLPLYLDRDVYIFNPNSTPIHQELLYNPTVDRFSSVSSWYLHTTLQFKKHIWQN